MALDVRNASINNTIRSIRMGFTYTGGVANYGTSSPNIPAVKINQVNRLTIVPAIQGETVAPPAQNVQVYTLTPVPAIVGNRFAKYQFGTKAIGSWTVGTDFIAEPDDGFLNDPFGHDPKVAINQNVLILKTTLALVGKVAVGPTINQNLPQMTVVAASQGQTATPVVFTQSDMAFTVNSAIDGFTVAAPTFNPATLSLPVAAARMGHACIDSLNPSPAIAVNIDVNQAQAVAAASQGFAVEAPNLFPIPLVFTPAFRTFRVPSETRLAA